ncbi:MAG: peptidase M50 [Oscillospiraceae bacterium]|nr:peptidase M50 [Oscillospiraceae bacterium]
MKRPVKDFSFTCSAGFLLMAAALLYLDGQALALQGALACALHELGHWLAIRRLGGRVYRLRLTLVGAEMSLNPRYPLSYWREALAALAGPAASLLCAALAARWGLYLFAGVNLCYGLFNLLPIYPLDGGRSLLCLLSNFGLTGAERAAHWTSVVCSGLLLGLGWTAWSRWGNPTLLCAALWLAIRALRAD